MKVTYSIPITHPLNASPTMDIIKELTYTIVASAIVYKLLNVKFLYKGLEFDTIGFIMYFDVTLDRSIIVNPSINKKTVITELSTQIMNITDAFRG